MKNKKNILVLTQWSFKDALIQAYTLPYLHIISDMISDDSKIYLVTFEQKHLFLNESERKITDEQLAAKKIRLITFTYSSFGILSLVKWFFAYLRLFFLIQLKKINVLHAWCMTAGTFAYLLSLTTRKPLIIDSYEPHAEAMVENKTWKRNGIKFRILFFFEKKLSRYADTVISATENMRQYALEKYQASFKKFYVKPACVDLNMFNPDKKKNTFLLDSLGLKEKIICVYAGKFGGIYLTKEVFEIFHEAELLWGNRFRALLLTNTDKTSLYHWADEAGFDKNKLIIEFVHHDKIAEYMGIADFAITPVKPVPTKKLCTPIKDGEYWALGLPVVITKNISDDSEIIYRNNTGAVLDDLTREEYKRAIYHIDDLLNENSNELSGKIFDIAKKYRSFSIAENIYKKIYADEQVTL